MGRKGMRKYNSREDKREKIKEEKGLACIYNDTWTMNSGQG